MENNINNFEKKKLLMKLKTEDINKNILYLINEARASPEEFSDHLLYLDDNDKHINYLSYFFKYSSNMVSPLLLDKNLSICSQDLLTHLITIDKGDLSFKYSEEEKIKNSLKERLKRINMIPIHYNNFIIIGTENSFEAIVNLLSNENYRNKILSPDMHLIGIASGLLPSDNLCIIIDVVQAIKININSINYIPLRKNFLNNKINYYENDNELDNNNYFNRRYVPKNYNTPLKIYKKKYPLNCYTSLKKDIYSDNKINNMNKMFNPNTSNSYFNRNKFQKKYYPISKSYDNKNDNGMNLRVRGQKSVYIKTNYNNEINKFLNCSTEFKIPISIYVDRQYIKNKKGKLVPIYTKESTYDDGSILIQPDVDEFEDFN